MIADGGPCQRALTLSFCSIPNKDWYHEQPVGRYLDCSLWSLLHKRVVGKQVAVAFICSILDCVVGMSGQGFVECIQAPKGPRWIRQKSLLAVLTLSTLTDRNHSWISFLDKNCSSLPLHTTGRGSYSISCQRWVSWLVSWHPRRESGSSCPSQSAWKQAVERKGSACDRCPRPSFLS